MKKQSASLLLVPAQRIAKPNGNPNGTVAPMPISIDLLSRHLRQSSGVLGVPLSDVGAFRTSFGTAVMGDCLDALRQVRSNTFDLVITSPPYDGQPKYGNGEPTSSTK